MLRGESVSAESSIPKAEYPDSDTSRPHWMTRSIALVWGLFCGIAISVAYAVATAITSWAWFAVAAIVIIHFVGAGICGTSQGREDWFAKIGRKKERER